MIKLIVGIGLILLILHYDFWNWESPSIVLGFIPSGLFYHILFSIGTSIYWAWVVTVVWKNIDEEETV